MKHFFFRMSNLDDSLAVFRHKLRPMADPSDSVIVEEDEVRLTLWPQGPLLLTWFNLNPNMDK